MVAPTLSLAHLPFFEALATLDETSAAWRSCSAGLLTLRLFDKWRDGEAGGLPLARLELAAVGEAVDALPPSDLTRPILARIVEGAGADARSERVLPQLMAYGRVLQLDARWLLAADVFGVLLEHPASAAQGDLAVPAALQRGYCLRMAGQLDEAERAYAAGREIATACGDEAAALRVEVGRANLALHRGNLPRAETILDRVIGEAERVGCADVLSRALHDRCIVAYRRGQCEEAVTYVHRALEACSDSAERDRMRTDLATLLGELGYRDAARDLHLVIAATAQEPLVRWVSTVNLLEFAVTADSELAFERYRRELEAAPLPPAVSAHFYLQTGMGYSRFGREIPARVALEKAVAVAQEYQVNEVLVKAERLLSDMRRTATSSSPPQPTPALAAVLRSVVALRVAAGIAAD